MPRSRRITQQERNQLRNQIDHATADARAGHRHSIPVDHDLARRLLDRLEALEHYARSTT